MRFVNPNSNKLTLLGILFLLIACSGPGVNGQASATPTPDHPSIPTTSPTPAPDLVYLILGDGIAGGMATRVENTITSLSANSGNEFIALTELSDYDLEQNAMVVFIFPPDPGLNDFAARFPSVQFVTIGIHGLSEAENLSRIGPDGLGADQIGFIAGVLAAAVSDDWRVGAVSVQNSSEESASNLGFQNGAMFYCGLCRQAFPPFHSYPLGVETSSADVSAVQDTIATLTSFAVDTIFLSPQLSAAASAEMLKGSGVSYVGSGSPGENLGEKWIATVRAAPELAIIEIWDRVRSGESGGTVSMPVIIEDINPERLTTGREAWVQDILQDLIDGYIDTGVDPITGTAR